MISHPVLEGIMGRILVSGLINLETTLRVDAFPLTYVPARYPFFGVNVRSLSISFMIAESTILHKPRLAE
jgi:hypothetical protein